MGMPLSVVLLVCAASPSGQAPPVTVAKALEFVQAFGRPEGMKPEQDRALKTALAAALIPPQPFTHAAVKDHFDAVSFRQLAGGEAIAAEKLEQLLKDATPKSREAMYEKTRQHLALLTTQFDMIGGDHHEANQKFVDWIVKNHTNEGTLHVITICTGNTRRSMLSATMGNLAAAYYGLNVRFSSGGTVPDAFNPRTIATLKEIGVEIIATGKEAERGPSGNANPIYTLRWGTGLEATEFSKKYTDATNPQKGFAAIMVCSEADASCPNVPGAGIRIPVKYLDPKAFDGAPFESAKYAERRDDIGRFMLSSMMQARRQLVIDGKLK